MLSRILLQFEDDELRSKYRREKKEFYQKAIPIICGMMVVLSLILEILYRVLEFGEQSVATTSLNWSVVGIFLALSFIVRRAVWTRHFICPILTCLTYYYCAAVDFETTPDIIYFM